MNSNASQINTVKLFEPSSDNPYVISKQDPIILRTACSAGVNRSATVREYIKYNAHLNSIIYPQYGACYGDYDNDEIVTFTIINNDGFQQIFNTNKCQNMQTIIFDQLNYTRPEDFIPNTLKHEHKQIYKEFMVKQYWSNNNKIYKNIFILINEDEEVIKLVHKRLSEINDLVDFVILRLPDIIFEPIDNTIVSQSREAYQEFINAIKHLIQFHS